MPATSRRRPAGWRTPGSWRTLSRSSSRCDSSNPGRSSTGSGRLSSSLLDARQEVLRGLDAGEHSLSDLDAVRAAPARPARIRCSAGAERIERLLLDARQLLARAQRARLGRAACRVERLLVEQEGGIAVHPG